MGRTLVRSYVGTFVRKIHAQYDKKYLRDDPVYFAHQYKDPMDQERAGLISALLAFGNVKAIMTSIKKVLGGDCSAGHRWVRASDLKLLLRLLDKVIQDYGSIKNFFLEGYKDADPDITNALHSFSQRLKELSKHYRTIALSHHRTKAFDFLFPSPLDKSPCKRLNLFLRWMVRPTDGIDLGLWKEIPPSKLIIPLDAHIFQFAKKFRLSRYKTPNWQMALDVTRFLKTLDHQDPIKYDFAICHYGMEKGWK